MIQKNNNKQSSINTVAINIKIYENAVQVELLYESRDVDHLSIIKRLIPDSPHQRELIMHRIG